VARTRGLREDALAILRLVAQQLEGAVGQAIFSGAPIDEDYLVHVVDEVMLPLRLVGPPN
jgi:hypothetical protein